MDNLWIQNDLLQEGNQQLPMDAPGIQLDPDLGVLASDVQLSSYQPSILSWSELMTDIEDFVVPDIIPTHCIGDEDDTITAGVIYQARVVFGMKQLKTYSNMFFQRRQTPFIHRHQYEENTPTIVQDALSICALYSGKNAENESMVFRKLSLKVQQLVSELERSWSSPTELLSSVQVLILYQIIRLFDGDIQQRAEAESNEPVLIGWTDQLKARMQPLTSVTPASSTSWLSSISDPTTTWQSWIFVESVRRTVLTCLMLRGIYSFLKLGWDNVSNQVRKLSFTAQSALWNALSDYHWQKARQELNHFAVALTNWDIIMAPVKPSDLDELGVLMIATIKGMDWTSEWLGRANLHKYGLEWGSKETTES